MSETLHKASEQWIGVINNQIVCHTGVVQFPMRKGWKRVHRLVVLPDFQGIGIGTRFINEVSKHYIENDLNMNLTTTTPSLVHALCKDKNWLLARAGRVTNVWGNKGNFNKETSQVTGSSINRITYSFNWKK